MEKADYEKGYAALANYLMSNFPLAMKGGGDVTDVAMRCFDMLRARQSAFEDPTTRLFVCQGCGRRMSWDKGAANEYPDHCDQCVAEIKVMNAKDYVVNPVMQKAISVSQASQLSDIVYKVIHWYRAAVHDENVRSGDATCKFSMKVNAPRYAYSQFGPGIGTTVADLGDHSLTIVYTTSKENVE